VTTPRDTDPTSPQPSFTDLLREDWERHGRKWHRTGFHAVAVYRLGALKERLEGPARLPVALLHGVLYLVVRNVYGIELPSKTRVGRRLEIGHQGGIVVAEAAVIGDDVTIRQNVTIGALESRGPTPVIGNGVEIGAGAVVVGGVTVGDGALIGPNAVVTDDVPPGGRAVAPPARIFGPGAEARSTAAAAAPRPLELDALLDVLRGALRDTDLDPETPLLSAGIVDSLNAAVLLTALEEAYGERMRPEDLDVEVFDTPAELLALLRERG
jgi:serine O-acetyltransferase